MAKIDSNSTPVYSGVGEWNVYDWIEFHKALVNKYYTNTMLIKKDGVIVAKNTAADNIWYNWYKKDVKWNTVFTRKAQQNILDTNSKYDDARKYLGMWANLAEMTQVKTLTTFNPVWASVKVTREVGDAIGSGLMTGLKIAKIAVPVIVGVLLLGITAYAVNSFRRKTRYIR